jgi:hypothetical protein
MRKRFLKWILKHDAAWRLNIQRSLRFSSSSSSFFLLESNVERTGQASPVDSIRRAIPAHERYVRLRLTFEKALVTALAETGGRVHNKFGIGRERDAAVAGEIETDASVSIFDRLRPPEFADESNAFRGDNDAPLPKAFPNKRLFHQCTVRPIFLVLKNLMNQLIDAGTGFAGAGVAGDEPATAELVAFPSQPAELRDMAFA